MYIEAYEYTLILLLLLQNLLYYLPWRFFSQYHGTTKYDGMPTVMPGVGYGLYLDDYEMSMIYYDTVIMFISHMVAG